MTDQGPRNRESDYDPFDTEHRPRGRPVAGPRLPDPVDRPLPPDPAQRPAPRPYQAWPTVRPEAIVPPEDNPMRGWRGLGLAMLSRDLWPKDARMNPIMAYFTGRKRGRLAEDLLGLSPWLFLIAFDVLVFFGVGRVNFAGIEWFYGPITFLAMLVGGGLIGASMTAFHLRRCMDSVPVDELLLTRMKPVDIVQGLSVRPIAVQSAGVFLYALLHSAALIGASVYHMGYVTFSVLSYALLSLAVRWYVLGVVVEMGSALALRANLCIRRPITALARTLFDLLLAWLVIGFMMLLIAAAFVLFMICSGYLAFLFAGMLMVAATLFMVVGGIMFAPFLAGVIRSISGEAMEFCYLHPDEWWMRTDDSESAKELRTRSAFAPWKPVPGRRRIFGRPDVIPPHDAADEERASKG